MTATARWGGLYARTSYTGVEARCATCGTYSALTVTDDGRFACRDPKACNLARGPEVERALAVFLAGLQSS